MKPLKPGIAAACFFLSPLLHAQADTAAFHDAKMQMICAAVNFYSKDTKLSRKPVSCEATDVRGLKSCAAVMINVDKKIDKWNGTPVRDGAALQRLGITILTDITHGKTYRERLPAYGRFKDLIRKLAVVPEPSVETPHADSLGAKPSNEPLPAPAPAYRPVSEPLGVTGAPAETAVPVLQAPPPVPLWQDPQIWSAAALLVAVLALSVALLSRSRSARRHSGRSRKPHSGFDEADASSAPSALTALQRKVSELEQDLRRIKVNMDDNEQALSDKLRQLETGHRNAPPAGQQTPVANASFPVTRRWAKNVDGGGFDLDALAPDPDSKMIYEITQTGRNAATYKVSDARDAQQFALSNPQNYLREGCTYTTQPAVHSRIRTEVPGTLELHGRKWKIVNPAQIAFS
jgi:hypothetical protein